MLLSGTADQGTIGKLVMLAERTAMKAGKRKLYFIHPLDDDAVRSCLAEKGYIAEGILRGPYREGQDAVVYSRFFSSN